MSAKDIFRNGLLSVIALCAQPSVAVDYTYWFDMDKATAGSGSIAGSRGNLVIDVSELDGNMHTIHFQVHNGDNEYSSVSSAMFATSFSLGSVTAYVYIDGKLHTTCQAGNYAENAVEFEVDATGLEYGLHSMMVQLMSRNGLVTSAVESLFMRVPSDSELESFACYYTIDNDTTISRAGSYANGIVHADIDVNDLTVGLHSIQFMAAADNGMSTQLKNSWFLKLPPGSGDIKSYDYWVNDDTKNIHHVQLENAISPFRLTALLPIPSYPLRSSSFHFEVKDGEPVIYPKNDFNMLISSARGTFTNFSTPYFDATMPTEVAATKIVADATGVKETIGNIASNEIKWLEIEAKPGELISVKADKSCTLQVFSPSGKELVNAIGADAVKVNEAFMIEGGCHWIAVHDSDENKRLSLEIHKYNKFELMHFTPEKNACKGNVFIDMTGNGFEKLKSVELEGADCRISMDTVIAFSNMACQARFKMPTEGAPCGLYSLRLTFSDEEEVETIIKENVVTVEPVVDGGVDVRIQAKSTTLSPFPVEVIVKNTGNKTFADIPLDIAFSTGDVRKVEFMNFSIPRFDYMLDSEEFPFAVITDNLFGKGINAVFMPLILPYLAPYQELRLILGFDVDQGSQFDFYAWAGTPWSEEIEAIENASVVQYSKRNGGRRVPQEVVNNTNLPCARDFHDHATSTVRLYTASAQAIGGIAILGDRPGQKMLEEMGAPPLDRNVSDYSFKYHGIDGNGGVAAPSQLAANLPGRFGDVAERYFEYAENPNPTPRATRCRRPSTVDPNDMIGYWSPGDSEYIGREVKTLSYTIEFENDPQEATIAAATVEVTNMLDKSVFDIDSFQAKSFRLGDKTIELDGKKSCVKTIDMRPEINGLAQVEVNCDTSSGIVKMFLTSLDPITLEPVEDNTQGVLPVNNDGNGIGELCYEIALREGLPDGTSVDNSASIVFDANDPIETPVWHNVTDYVLPESNITGVETADNRRFEISVVGTDAASGIWQYDLYARWNGQLSWQFVAEGVEDTDGKLIFESADELEGAEFTAVAYDRAGNRQYSAILDRLMGDVDSNGAVDANDVVLIRAFYAGRPVTIDTSVGDLNADGAIDAQDAVAVSRVYLSSYPGKHIRKRLIFNRK